MYPAIIRDRYMLGVDTQTFISKEEERYSQIDIE